MVQGPYGKAQGPRALRVPLRSPARPSLPECPGPTRLSSGARPCASAWLASCQHARAPALRVLPACTYQHPVRISSDRRFISASEGGLCSSSIDSRNRRRPIQRPRSTASGERLSGKHTHQNHAQLCCDSGRCSACSAISRSLSRRDLIAITARSGDRACERSVLWALGDPGQGSRSYPARVLKPCTSPRYPDHPHLRSALPG